MIKKVNGLNGMKTEIKNMKRIQKWFSGVSNNKTTNHIVYKKIDLFYVILNYAIRINSNK